MGFLALDLGRRGWAVSASDGEMFAPMDKILSDAGLRIAQGFSPRRIPAGTELLVAGAAFAFMLLLVCTLMVTLAMRVFKVKLSDIAK